MPAATAPPRTELVHLTADAPAAESIDLVGGKGAALHSLIRAGLPVPPAAVVVTTAYEQVVTGSAALRAVIADPPDDDGIDAAFVGTMPAGLRHSVVAARQAIAPSGPVVARSSATTEDLGGASFAGQFRSVIGIESDDDLLRAVEQVWASLWHLAPRTYRRLHVAESDRVAMAVVIQPMVASVTAGVVFTVDPSSEEERIRVERVAGQGEGLVSGELTPDVFLLGRATLESTPDADVLAAARLALEAEAEFGAPQDVEWAADRERVWVVQSRPITTAAARSENDGFDSVADVGRRYTTAGIAEMLPGVLPPLRWATAGFMVDHAFAEVLDRLGGLPDDVGRRFVVRLRGRAAVDLDYLAAVAGRMPGGSAGELERQLFGTAADAARDGTSETGSASRWAKAGQDMRVLSANRRARSEQAIVDHAVRAVVDPPLDAAHQTDAELLAVRAWLVDLGVRATVAEMAVAAAAVAAFGRLEEKLVRHLGSAEGTRWALGVTSDLRTETVLDEVSDLAAYVVESSPDACRTSTWADARSVLDQVARSDVAELVERTARRAGSQRSVGGPTWDEDMDAFWRLVCASAVGGRVVLDRHEELDRLVDVLKTSPGWQRRRWLTGQVVDSRLLVVRRLVRDAINLLGRRETAKAALLALGGRIRAVDRELGRRLTSTGALFDATDVDLLTPGEIAAALTGGERIALDTIVRRRRCGERWRSEPDLPQTFTGRPVSREQPVPTGDRLEGWAASGGRHTGPVRCLNEPDAGAVRPGDVVVARRTDASWSPVFLRAAAVIVEEGGPLSHAAIVARELGLPAVVNVPGVVARLREEAQPVTVDGDAGIVIVRDDERIGVGTCAGVAT